MQLGIVLVDWVAVRLQVSVEDGDGVWLPLGVESAVAEVLKVGSLRHETMASQPCGM